MEDVTAEAIAKVQAALRAKGAPEDMLAALPDQIPFRLLCESESSALDGMYIVARDDGSEIARLSWSTSPEEVPVLLQIFMLAVKAFSPAPPPSP